MADLIFKPGVVKETTAYDVGQGFVDANLIRWRGPKAAPVNGWYQRATGAMTGVCRAIHEFSNNSGIAMVGFGTHSNAYILSGDSLYDITPAGLASGLVNATVATGYGIGTYGTPGAGGLGYGLPRIADPDPFAQVIQQPRIWSIDNFGQDLILCPYADVGNPGRLYIWHSVGGFGAKASLLSADPSADGVPAWVRGAFVSTQAQCVIAAGCCPLDASTLDPMQIRWSSFANPYAWRATASNQAGSYRLPSGSYIVGWLNTYYETLFFTDTTVYSMQLVGGGLVFGFQAVGQGMSMISPKAAITNGSVTMWMDNGCFYQYSGTISELPCPLKAFLFGNGSGATQQTGDVNRAQAFKIFAAHNHSNSEAWWFYQSATGSEVDSYVMVNYATGLWSNGKLGRTAWSDSGHLNNPIATDASGNIFMHEYGTDQQLTGSTVALPFSLTTGDFCIQQGDVYTLLERIIPDFVWQGSTGNYQQICLDVRVRDSSNETPRVVKTFVITPNANNAGYDDMKVRGRRISFRIYSSGVPGAAWTLGKLQAQYVPNGRR